MVSAVRILIVSLGVASSFTAKQRFSTHHRHARIQSTPIVDRLANNIGTSLHASRSDNDNTNNNFLTNFSLKSVQNAAQSLLFALALGCTISFSPAANAVTQDKGDVVACLLQNCPAPFAKCITNPNCLANVICINTCAGKPDEVECQVKCGNLYENDVVGEFNKCAVSAKDCVKQQEDNGQYPVPANEKLVQNFDTKLFNGRWFITAGQNKLFDTFPCQVHFFTETKPGQFFGKLNWRIEEPDGNTFDRDALQVFVQDPKQPGHLVNDNNEYLNYSDDWYVIDYEYDNNNKNVPPFAFIYYRGSNDAWDGYGGAVVYTRDSKLPESLRPRLREAAKKVGYDFDKDFTLTDNTCPVEKSLGEKTMLRSEFAGKIAMQTGEQMQTEVTRMRRGAANKIASKTRDLDATAEEAVQNLGENLKSFEQELQSNAAKVVGGTFPDLISKK